jgi:chemotaxis response regulator CheB
MTRIFIYSKPSLFSQGVESLLIGKPDMQVIGWASESDDAVKKIHELQPDIILVVNREFSLKASEDWKHFVSEGINTSIIELNLQMNIASYYRIEHQTVGQAEDLVKIIEQSKNSAPVEIIVDENVVRPETGDSPGTKA